MKRPRQILYSLRVGEPVIWPAAPLSVAQIEELRRTSVRLVYPTRTGRLRHPIVRVDRLMEIQGRPPAEVGLAINMFNPLRRAIPTQRRERAYQVKLLEGATAPGGVR